MRLGELIENVVEILTTPIKPLADAINNFIKDFANTLKQGIVMLIEHFEGEFKPDMDKLLPKELREHDYFKSWENYINEHAGKKPIALAPILAYLGTSVGGVAIGLGLGGFGRNIQNFFNSQLTPTPLSPQEIAYGFNRGLLKADKREEYLKQNGYASDLHMLLTDMYKPKLTVTELADARLKSLITQEDFEHRLSEHGFSQEEIKIINELIYAYPTPTDFIRFAVRDVFVEDKEVKDALEAEFPEGIVEYAEKAGMRKDVLMWYWKAHWELPSPTQVYEMLHRLHPDVLKVRGDAYKDMGLELDKLTTTLDTVKFYLKQADYDKRWRQRLLAISYSPLTRVDLRRIYELGLINEEELLARLMEIGYTRKDAELMLQFYKNYRQEEGRGFTKSEIKNLFYYGLLNEAETSLLLQKIGYSEGDAKTLIELWKANIEEKDLRETQKYIRDAYALGQITREEAERELRECGLSEEVIDVVLAKEDKRRLTSQKLPSASTVVKWIKLGVITEEKAREILKKINVAEEYIDYYIAEGKAS